MNKKVLTKIKLLILIVVICLGVWFLGISPILTFRSNEEKLTKAAKRYYELNPDKLPTGERVRTLYLNTLYKESYIENDFKMPYTGKICSIEKSWVKVVRDNDDYKYYTYLDCGTLKSNIDHDGPKITLNGDTDITVDYGEKFNDPGIKSVVDNVDGKIKVENAEIKGEVDTNKPGSYIVQYIALDSLNNKSVVERKVKVVKRLNQIVKKALGKEKYYKGFNPNNYLYFSNNLFRIIGIDGNNVKIVSNNNVSFVNYDGIDKWFKYYDSNLTDSAKKLIVKNKYCNMTYDGKDLNVNKCSSYGNRTKYGLVSIDDINNTISADNSFLLNKSITWLSNLKNKNEAYAFKNGYGDVDGYAHSFYKMHNLAVRPVITIDGNTLIKRGNGTYNNPYLLTDFVKTKKDEKINTRYAGEYISYSGYLWRIQGVEKDGTTKIILDSSLYDDNQDLIKIYYDDSIKNKQYNPSEKGNVGYYINNNVSKYIDTKYFVKHQIDVPIYKGEPAYGKEVGTKNYSVKISAPNMYEMYSASSDFFLIKSYWLINSSKTKSEIPGVSETGSMMYGDGSTYYEYGIRPVAYLKESTVITSGKGTILDPFTIKK